LVLNNYNRYFEYKWQLFSRVLEAIKVSRGNTPHRGKAKPQESPLIHCKTGQPISDTNTLQTLAP
jgi:hypothetical protein